MAALPPDGRLRIALLGGVPAALGGGGLELQIGRTAAALRERGHDVDHVERLDRDASFDVLHAFGSEANVWFAVRHWRRNAAPLVLTPVIVASPGAAERVMLAAAALPGVMTTSRMRRELLRRADAVVCLTEYERRLVRRLGRREEPVVVVPNGADTVAPDLLPPVPGGAPDERFVLMLGAVSPRKRQRELLAALAGRLPVVVAGGWDGPAAERDAFERELGRCGGVWLGEVSDPAEVQAIQRRALAQVLMSTAEAQSLAVLESLAVGLPVVVSDIPSHRELQALHPGLVHLAETPEAAAEALLALRNRPRPAPAPVPSWEEVAARLEPLYREVARRNGPRATSPTSRRSSGRIQRTK